ncbi:MAG: hypothetical protein ACR2J5_14100, partial [Geodermatophilaceae bacterium]
MEPGIKPTDDQRRFNEQVTSIRFVVEQAIAHIKNWHIMTIAVGTALASGPPRRSQRALLTHWAPA